MLPRRVKGTKAAADLRDAKSQMSRNLKSEEWRWKAATIVVVVAGYFASSLALTFFQKSLISHLRFPLTIVSCHLVLKFCLSGLCRQVWSACTGKQRVVLTWRNYMSRVAFVAFFSALDIGLSQWSFEFITVSLYTMTKTTAVLFILLFALAFRLERKHWTLIVIVLMISIGLFLFVYKSTTFHSMGFLMALSAAFFSGARWTLSQLIMQKSKLGLENPIDLIYHIQPLMVLTLLPFAAGFEGLSFSSSENAFRFHDYNVMLTTVGLIGLGGTIAFVMEVFEFCIVTKASSLTLSIVGIIKEIVTILLDVFFNGSELSSLNILGVVICLTGIGLHVVRKTSNAEESESSSRPNRIGASYGELRLPLLSEDSDNNTDEDELFHMGVGSSSSTVTQKKYRDFDDDFFLRDNREWTSIRNSQMQMGEDSLENPPIVLLRDGNPATGRDKGGILLADIELQSD